MSIPLTMCLIIPKPTALNTILGQVVNQTFNAFINYYNRNASSNYTNQDICNSYVLACISSIIVGLGIRKALESRTKHMMGAKLVFCNSISATLACAAAGFINAYIMR
jgi:hypothetical protein